MLRLSYALVGAITAFLAPLEGCSQAIPRTVATLPNSCEWRGDSLSCRDRTCASQGVLVPGVDRQTLAQADAGDAASMRKVGLLYSSGAPENLRDPQLALTWLRKAAAKG